MRGFLRKILILAGSDIVSNFRSTWYYFVIIIGPLLMISIVTNKTSESNATVLVVDKINNSYSQELISEIASEGYKLAYRDDYARARDDVKNDRAYFALSIEETGGIRLCFVHPYERDNISKTVDRAVKKVLIEKYENRRKRAKSPLFKLNIGQEDIFENTPERSNLYSQLIYRLWCLSIFLSVVVVILSKESYSKLGRKYSPLEFLLGKIVSGFTLTFIIGIAMFLTLIMYSIKCSSYMWAFIDVAIACLSGTMVGLMFGFIPISLRASMADTILGGVLGVAVFFLLSNSIGGTYFPITGFSPVLRSAARWLPVYPLLRFTNWTAVLGRGLDYVVVRELFIRLIQIFVIQFLICWGLLKRI